MANTRPGAPNGVPNGHTPVPKPPAQQPTFNRPFTLNEALPYTPFSSVAPFDSDIIPTPVLGSALPASSLDDLVSRTDFEALNIEAINPSLTSKRLDQTLAQVQHLLDPKRITQYTFKFGPKPVADSSPVPLLADGLAPFTKMVFDQAAVSFRYPTPETPHVASPTEHPGTPASRPKASPVVKKAQEPKAGAGTTTGKKHAKAAKVASGAKAKQADAARAASDFNEKAHAHNAARFEIIPPAQTRLDSPAASTTSSAVKSPVSVSRPLSSAAPMDGLAAQMPGQSHTTGQAHQAPRTSLSAQDQPIASDIPPTLVKVEAAAEPIAQAQPAAQFSEAPPMKTSQSPEPKSSIMIEIHQPVGLDKSEYMVVPDSPDAPDYLSTRKRKRNEYEDSHDLYGDSLDQRQRADTAFRDLQRCFQDIFEAENRLERGTVNEIVYLTNDQEPTLASGAQQKVQSLLEKSISLKCFQDVPLEDLLRVLKLSEGALKHAESLEVAIDPSWGESEVEAWLNQLPEIETGLKAARTSLRMMCGGREEKQLQSEDTITQSLTLFKNVTNGIIVPLGELRPASPAFKLLGAHKKAVASLFTNCQRLFSLMVTVITSIKTSSMVLNSLEYTATDLIFIENAHAERESVIDIQKFDGLRLVAMDVLSQIFLINAVQRREIISGILTRLEKLPVGKQRARQFKLIDGTSIQPVSALIMRLVQSSAGKLTEQHESSVSKVVESTEEGAADGEEDEDGSPTGQTAAGRMLTINSEEEGAEQDITAVQELKDIGFPLMVTAKRHASTVINFIVQRALKSTKSDDTPYRNLLDLFVEDFTSCLDNPDWPAAEMLLRLLMQRMVQQVEGEKTSAPAKNMALEILGGICAAISKLRSHVRKTANMLDSMGSDELGRFLSDLAASALERQSRPDHMVAWAGPYRTTLEYIEGRSAEDPHLTSAISYLISEWANRLYSWYLEVPEDQAVEDPEMGRLAYRLRMMIQDRRWLSNEYSFKAVTPPQARLAYAITLLRSYLCESFGAILNILLNSMASDQATVRSKSLKSINQVLETDPSILDGESLVVQLILQCSADSSTQVRDSALGLIGKSIAMRPALEEKMTPTVIQRFIDTGPGVRKRAMKLAKDIYLRNRSKAVRSTIANGLLHRVQDPEESVRDLARQMIEEIWFTPYHDVEASAASRMSLADHVALMVQTVKHGNVTSVLDKVLQTILSHDSKSAQANLDVCTKLVANMFDLVDNPDTEDSALPSGRDALQVLMIFAKADARLFTFEQIRLLKPHITSIGTSEDVAVSRAVVVIYRRVLPQLSSVHSQFLADVRKELMPAVSKVSRALLDDIVACLWIISGLLETSEHLARLVLSSLTAIQKIRAIGQHSGLDELKIRQFERYSLIVGMAGKHCDLDSHHEIFKKGFPKWTGTSVSKLMVDVIVPLASPAQQLEVRKAALDAVGLVCQSWPRNYVAPNIYTVFQQVFEEESSVLESMILRSFKEFLMVEEKRSEQAAEALALNGAATEKKRELTVMGGTNYDDVASATTHRFLKDITRIALAAQDDHSFLAVEVLATINRQGLVHPKETGVTLITLETSSHPKISELAFLEHKALHEKHETVLEREYVKAIQSAFIYQRDIAKDPHGATTNPFNSKLHLLMEVMKISKTKNRHKFLEKICGLVDFDYSKLDLSEEIPSHVAFSRFIIENIAFFEFITIGEVHAIVNAMEKLVTSTGATVAQTIESDIFQVRMDMIDAEPGSQMAAGENTAGYANADVFASVDINRLRQLTAASMILLALWEARTFLRRLYGMGTGRRDAKTKMATKDLTKAATKVQGITGDKLWEDISHIMTAMSTRERMLQTCRSLVELLNVDNEFKVVDDDDEMDGEDPRTPEADSDGDDANPASGRGRKRKASSTPGNRKKRARSNSQPRKRGRPRKNPVIVDEDADGDFEEDF